MYDFALLISSCFAASGGSRSRQCNGERVAAQDHECDQRPDGAGWVGIRADEFHKGADTCSFADFI
jgi:hypothetical protein